MPRPRLAVCAAAFAIAGLTASAHAQAWLPTARQCSEHVGRTAAAWPLWAQCTVAKAFPQVSPARTQQCIRQVEASRARKQECAMCGSPIGEVVRCATAGGQ